MKYRKKPVVIEAIQWDGTEESYKEIRNSYTGLYHKPIYAKRGKASDLLLAIQIDTGDGDKLIHPHYFLVSLPNGKFEVCRPDIFEMTYERCEEGDVGTCKQSTK